MKKTIALSLAAALSLSLLSGCSTPTPAPSAQPSQPAAESYTYADTVAWDGQYDVVVIGFGGAGAVASSTAADDGARGEGP